MSRAVSVTGLSRRWSQTRGGAQLGDGTSLSYTRVTIILDDRQDSSIIWEFHL